MRRRIAAAEGQLDQSGVVVIRNKQDSLLGVCRDKAESVSKRQARYSDNDDLPSECIRPITTSTIGSFHQTKTRKRHPSNAKTGIVKHHCQAHSLTRTFF